MRYSLDNVDALYEAYTERKWHDYYDRFDDDYDDDRGEERE